MEKSDTRTVSVIVSTYRREEELCNIIDQLKIQNYPHYEIIVVDQTKKHTERVQTYLENNKKAINYHKLERANLCYARNQGIIVSKGEIALFIDDDVSIKKDFIFHHAKNYDDPTVVSVVGQVLDANNPKPKDIPPRAKLLFFCKEKVSLHSNQKGYITFGRGCNMSFRRIIFEEVGMFDENLAIKDELDVYMRIHKRGYNVIFEPMANVYHHEAKRGGVAEIKQRSDNHQSNEKIRKLSRDETIFHLKHFNVFTFIIFFFLLQLRYSFKWNFPRGLRMLSGFKSTIGGVREGIRTYHQDYK